LRPSEPVDQAPVHVRRRREQTVSALEAVVVTRARTTAPAVALLACAAVLLTGCSSGREAVARREHAPADGVMANSGNIRVVNALVIAPEDGDTGVITMTVANRGDRADQLTDVRTSDGTVDYTGSRDLPGGRALAFGADSNPSATVHGLRVRPGEILTMTLSFRDAEPIRLRTVVVPASGDYAGMTAAPDPTESPSAGPTEPGGGGSGTAVPSGSAVPSPTG
jgi:hypothetical protein